MFSIGMGVACAFNPAGINNKSIFKKIKDNILLVRHHFLFYFMIATIAFLPSQLSTHQRIFNFYEVNIMFDAALFSILYSLMSIIYFVINFLAIQKLNFDIAERIMKENN